MSFKNVVQISRPVKPYIISKYIFGVQDYIFSRPLHSLIKIFFFFFNVICDVSLKKFIEFHIRIFQSMMKTASA